MSNVTHWSNGGHGIKNFPKEELPIYKLAISRYNKVEETKNFYIDDAMPDEAGKEQPDQESLCWKNKAESGAKFWDVFKQCKREVEGTDSIFKVGDIVNSGGDGEVKFRVTAIEDILHDLENDLVIVVRVDDLRDPPVALRFLANQLSLDES